MVFNFIKLIVLDITVYKNREAAKGFCYYCACVCFVCVCVRQNVCVRERVCVCVFERERERETVWTLFRIVFKTDVRSLFLSLSNSLFV